MCACGLLHARDIGRTWSEGSRDVRNKMFVAGATTMNVMTAIATTVQDVSNGLRDRVRSLYHLDPHEEIRTLGAVAKAQGATARAARARQHSEAECSERAMLGCRDTADERNMFSHRKSQQHNSFSH